jgi:hypothetical protein
MSKRTKPLLERWREVAVSRFGKALLDECERNGGIAEYLKLLGTKQPTFSTWIHNLANPGPKVVARMVEVSPALIPHLQERGCIKTTETAAGPLQRGLYRRKQASAPLTASAPTTDVAERQHTKALTEAENRARKLRRRDRIRSAAKRMQQGPQQRKRSRDLAESNFRAAHYNPAPVGRYFDEHVQPECDVAVPDSYNPEEL